MPNTAKQQSEFATRQEFSEPPVVKSSDSARAGVTGHGVRGVLIASTLGVIVLFALTFWYYFA